MSGQPTSDEIDMALLGMRADGIDPDELSDDDRRRMVARYVVEQREADAGGDIYAWLELATRSIVRACSDARGLLRKPFQVGEDRFVVELVTVRELEAFAATHDHPDMAAAARGALRLAEVLRHEGHGTLGEWVASERNAAAT